VKETVHDRRTPRRGAARQKIMYREPEISKFFGWTTRGNMVCADGDKRDHVKIRRRRFERMMG
jgi:hypothetical protein